MVKKKLGSWRRDERSITELCGFRVPWVFMKKIIRLFKAHYYKPLLVFALLTFWQFFVMIFQVKEYIIPSPLSVLARIFVPEMAGKHQWLKHIQATFIEIFFGFAITAILGVFLAILISWSRLLKGIISPLLTFFNSIPKIAMAPLFILWFGYGIIPNILIAFLIAFFPVVINTVTGLNAVEEELLELVRYMDARKWQVFLKIRLPNSLPYIFSGLKISTTLCVVGAIVGEFIASTKGLGFLLKDSQAAIDTPPMFAGLLLISVLGLGLFGIISLCARALMPWQKAE
jgi:NitT/TauT family transport system permease protein